MSENICQECGMLVEDNEYHPYAACLMFKGCHMGEVVRVNLAAVRAHGAQYDSGYDDLADEAEALRARLSEYERHVMLRPKEAPEWADTWHKYEDGDCIWWVTPVQGMVDDGTNEEPAVDLFPNEDGPITLMLVGGDD